MYIVIHRFKKKRVNRILEKLIFFIKEEKISKHLRGHKLLLYFFLDNLHQLWKWTVHEVAFVGELAEVRAQTVRHGLLLLPRDEGVVRGPKLHHEVCVGFDGRPVPGPAVISTCSLVVIPQVSDTC